MTADPALEAVLAVPVRVDRKRAYSPLYSWMKANYDVLAADFEQKGPQWTVRVAAMCAAGLTDGDGKPPTIRTAQATWYRVRARLEPKRRKARKATPRTEQEPAVALPPPQPRERAVPSSYQARPLSGQPSRLVDWTAADVSRGTNQDDDPPTGPMGEKI